ncbi:MAG: PQQ-binding-like beta-propeller repeat protein [Alphaproteobacteria bacterium]|nr:PQQ-binding-like beta-propeller repeat protein [Alphaproteobacteria bacterium]
MKKIVAFSVSKLVAGLVFGLVLAGCSSKEPLEGVRKDMILSEVQQDEIDDTPVVLDQTSVNLNKNLKLLWSSDLEYGCSKSLRMASSVAVGNGKVFCIDAGGLVYAFDAKSGEKIWKKTTTIKGKDGQVGGALSYSDGKLVVTSSFAEAFAFDESNGEILWRIKLPACCKGDGITIADGKVYMLCDNSSLQVVDIQDGKLLWSHSGMIMDTTYLGSAGVVVRDDVVYLSYPSGEVFALLGNGSVLWSSMLSKFSFVNAGESFSHPRACPIMKDNLIYFTSANRQITAFDAGSGNVVWKKDFGGLETPLVSGNSLFVLDSSADLVCLNKDNGKVRWTCRLKVRGGDNSGWFGRSEVPSAWFGPIQTSDGVAVLSSNGTLVMVSAEDGSIKSSRQVGDFDQGITARPIISENMLYLTANDGTVLAYK